MPNAIKKTEICEFCGNDFTRRCNPSAYIGNNCFSCSFWLKKINLSAEDKVRRVIVNGQHYRLGHVHSGPFRGFGGRKFTVLFHDGRMVETSNLWCQGEIPERFKEWFPDNAVFVPIETESVISTNEAGIPF